MDDAIEVFFREHDELLARSQYREEIAAAHEVLKTLFKAAGIRAKRDIEHIHASRTSGTHQVNPDLLLFARLAEMGIDPEDSTYKTVLDCMTSKELAMVPWCARQLAGWIRQTPGASAARIAARYQQIGDQARTFFFRKHGFFPEESPIPDRPLTLDDARTYLKKLQRDIGQPSLFDEQAGDNDGN